jgi:hypothetical protein
VITVIRKQVAFCEERIDFAEKTIAAIYLQALPVAFAYPQIYPQCSSALNLGCRDSLQCN